MLQEDSRNLNVKLKINMKKGLEFADSKLMI